MCSVEFDFSYIPRYGIGTTKSKPNEFSCKSIHIHVDGRVDPSEDIATINTELALADLDTVERALDKQSRKARSGGKDAAAAVAVLDRLNTHLSDGEPVRTLAFTAADRAIVEGQHGALAPLLERPGGQVDRQGLATDPLRHRTGVLR